MLATLLNNFPVNDSRSASASPEASGADSLKAIQDATNVEALVAAMRTKYAETAELHYKACLALGGMVKSNEDNRVKAGNPGAVEAVVAAMRTHREDEALQQAVCDTLIHVNTDKADNRA
jgi:hypothetical protein